MNLMDRYVNRRLPDRLNQPVRWRFPWKNCLSDQGDMWLKRPVFMRQATLTQTARQNPVKLPADCILSHTQPDQIRVFSEGTQAGQSQLKWCDLAGSLIQYISQILKSALRHITKKLEGEMEMIPVDTATADASLTQ